VLQFLKVYTIISKVKTICFYINNLLCACVFLYVETLPPLKTSCLHCHTQATVK